MKLCKCRTVKNVQTTFKKKSLKAKKKNFRPMDMQNKYASHGCLLTINGLEFYSFPSI